MLHAACERHDVVKVDPSERGVGPGVSPRGAEATERIVHGRQIQLFDPIEIHPLHDDAGYRWSLATDETRHGTIARVFSQELQQRSSDQTGSTSDDSASMHAYGTGYDEDWNTKSANVWSSLASEK